jgi:S-adenosyl-L-methionine hydrolase (adenosine-forming)
VPAFVVFLTDFGLQDDFVGTCHGVIKRIAPTAEIIDLTHGIEPGSVLHGALVLANTLPYVPAGIHLAVVDPGVGGSRRPVVIRDSEGRMFVGPDNGLLAPAAERAGPIEAAYELANPAYALEPVSRTFHGRDLFSPAAAHLARGVDPAELGPPLDPAALVHLDLPEPRREGDLLCARVLYVDRFGNVALNLERAHLQALELVPGTLIEVELEGTHHEGVVARTFADARAGQLMLYEDSYRKVALAVSRGDAGQLLAVQPGDELRIRRARRDGLPDPGNGI